MPATTTPALQPQQLFSDGSVVRQLHLRAPDDNARLVHYVSLLTSLAKPRSTLLSNIPVAQRPTGSSHQAMSIDSSCIVANSVCNGLVQVKYLLKPSRITH
jgi:hypothetical protein